MARSGLAPGVFLRVELPQELVAAGRPVGILLHRLLEEGGNVLVPGVAGVADVLAVVVARLEGVVLHRDEIEDHVAKACLTCRHRCSPHWYRLVADALRLPLSDGVNRPARGIAYGLSPDCRRLVREHHIAARQGRYRERSVADVLRVVPPARAPGTRSRQSARPCDGPRTSGCVEALPV